LSFISEAAIVGLVLLGVSPLFKWVNFANGGVIGLKGDGKIVLGITVLAIAICLAVLFKAKWFKAGVLAVQAWGTVAVFWMAALIWKVGSLVKVMCRMPFLDGVLMKSTKATIDQVPRQPPTLFRFLGRILRYQPFHLKTHKLFALGIGFAASDNFLNSWSHEPAVFPLHNFLPYNRQAPSNDYRNPNWAFATTPPFSNVTIMLEPF